MFIDVSTSFDRGEQPHPTVAPSPQSERATDLHWAACGTTPSKSHMIPGIVLEVSGRIVAGRDIKPRQETGVAPLQFRVVCEGRRKSCLGNRSPQKSLGLAHIAVVK